MGTTTQHARDEDGMRRERVAGIRRLPHLKVACVDDASIALEQGTALLLELVDVAADARVLLLRHLHLGRREHHSLCACG